MKASKFARRKIKPPQPERCPFCTSTSTRLSTMSGLCFVWCRNCQAQGPRFDSSDTGKAKAISFWKWAGRPDIAASGNKLLKRS